MRAQYTFVLDQTLSATISIMTAEGWGDAQVI